MELWELAYLSQMYQWLKLFQGSFMPEWGMCNEYEYAYTFLFSISYLPRQLQGEGWTNSSIILTHTHVQGKNHKMVFK